jgi:hypothetical protein
MRGHSITEVRVGVRSSAPRRRLVPPVRMCSMTARLLASGCICSSFGLPESVFGQNLPVFSVPKKMLAHTVHTYLINTEYIRLIERVQQVLRM